MSTTTQELKYLLRVGYEDGTVLDQPADDKYSKHDDKAEHNPSAFRDFLDYEEKSKMIWAELIGVSENEYEDIMVDLRSGLFVVKGKTIQIHEQNYVPKDLKLIYFRENRIEWIDGVEQPAYINAYYIGWQERNSNTKHTIAVG